MRLLLALIFATFATVSSAGVLVVNVFQPLPGKANLTASYMNEARQIINDMGQQAGFTSDMKGIYRFNMYFESYEAYGAFSQRIGSNPAWQAFQAKTSASPSATQIDNLMLQEQIQGPGVNPGNVSDVTVWNVPPFQMQQAVEGARGAIEHHVNQGAMGASVWSYAGQMYYITTHESLEAWGKFRDTPNPAFGAYMMSQVDPATGVLPISIARQNVLVAN